MLRPLLALAFTLVLAGCEFYAPAKPDTVARARYVSEEPPSVTLISMVSNRTGKAAHSALLINGSERVLYDPAGTFEHPDLPRRDDIHYGITPRFLDYYKRYHARFDYYVHAQKVPVSRETADRIFQNALAQGKTPKMLCAGSVTASVNDEQPFTGVRYTLFPERVREDFAQIPGVEDSYVREVDVGKNNVWEGPSATAP
jgi:hypothetical protein